MKYLAYASVCLIASLYFFPLTLSFVPIANTKLILSVFGLVIFIYDISVRNYRNNCLTDLMVLSLYALGVSFCGLFSVTLNNTSDYSYAGYIGSMWVWFASAYFVVRLIYNVHGRVDFTLIANYLIAVCCIQCLAAILNDQVPSFKSFVDEYTIQGQDFINSLPGKKRKYGLGALLDTAGVRFSAVLLIIAVLIVSIKPEINKKWIWIYSIAFLFISIEGNIISRTTLVGVGFGLIYLLYFNKYVRKIITESNQWMKLGLISSVLIISIGIVYLYNTDESFKSDLRFGFEGIFSLFEKGEWDVSSNDRLQSMYVYPDNIKTWIIGDGYFSNPINTDPYFIGKITGGYYMGTDVGFLRYIYYFGLIGLIVFGIFFFKCAEICSKYFNSYKSFFYLLVFLNFIIWLKVSTDLFVTFAPFIAAGFFLDKDTNTQSL